VQVQGSTHHHDPAVTAVSRSTHSTHIFVFDVVGEGNCGLSRMGLGFGADFQLPVHHHPLGGQFEILIVRKAQFAVDRQTAQRRRRDVEDDVCIVLNGDHSIFGRHLFVRPGSWIRPALRAGRRSLLLRFEYGISAEA